MRTSEGGLSRAKRDNVALATTRRASIEDARHPLSPTTFEETCFFKAGFFSSGVSQLTLLFIRDIPLYACLCQETRILLINIDSYKLTFIRRPLTTEWGIIGRSLTSLKMGADT
jgi:hypothetical protein